MPSEERGGTSPFAEIDRVAELASKLPHPVPVPQQSTPPRLFASRMKVCVAVADVEAFLEYAKLLLAPGAGMRLPTWRTIAESYGAKNVVCLTNSRWETVCVCVAVAILGLREFGDQVFKRWSFSEKSLRTMLSVASACAFAQAELYRWKNKPDFRMNDAFLECNPYFISALQRACETVYRTAVLRDNASELSQETYAGAMHSLHRAVSLEGKNAEDVGRLGRAGEVLGEISLWLCKACAYEYHSAMSRAREVGDARLAFWHQTQAWEATKWIAEHSGFWEDQTSAAVQAVQERLMQLEGRLSVLDKFSVQPDYIERQTFPSITEEDFLNFD